MWILHSSTRRTIKIAIATCSSYESESLRAEMRNQDKEPRFTHFSASQRCQVPSIVSRGPIATEASYDISSHLHCWWYLSLDTLPKHHFQRIPTIISPSKAPAMATYNYKAATARLSDVEKERILCVFLNNPERSASASQYTTPSLLEPTNMLIPGRLEQMHRRIRLRLRRCLQERPR